MHPQHLSQHHPPQPASQPFAHTQHAARARATNQQQRASAPHPLPLSLTIPLTITQTQSSMASSTRASQYHHHHSKHGTDLLSTSQDVLTALDRSAMALNMIAHTLENEFEERFGHTGANPLEVAKRLRKLQRELPALKQECQSVLQCKQELVDSARRLLDSNTSQLQQLCERSGFAPRDDQGVHEAYGAAVKDWEGQMLQRCAGLADDVGQRYNSRSLNQALASARLQ